MDADERTAILELLRSGAMEIEGLLPWSSNYAFLVQVSDEKHTRRAVYKPSRGERPLWDFPAGSLCSREFAAFLVSDALGWHLVPPTVVRDGEQGAGSVQLFVEHDPDQHYFSFEGEPQFRIPLQKMVLFDVVINNADRKGGHVIVGENGGGDDPNIVEGYGRVWGIDHGICFHHDHKLRTVIWEFAGSDIPPALQRDLQSFAEKLADTNHSLRRELVALLSEREIIACERRLQRLLRRGIFPQPGPGRHYPWPPV
jgi:hypothetical protein